MSRWGSALLAVLIAIVIGLMGLLAETGSTQAGRPSPSPVPCEPSEVEVTRVWFVRVKRADGVYGRIQVNARNWEAAGAEAANLSGAEPQSISSDTLTLGQVEWDE